MQWTKQSGFALLLIAFGALILIDKIGFGLGHLMGYIVPFAMVGLGWLGIKNGRGFIGWTLLVIGLIVLLGKFSGLIGLAIAIGLICYGFSMLKKTSQTN